MSNFSYADIFKSLPTKDQADAERLLNTAFGMLSYMKDGESFKTSFATFKKLSADVIYIDYKKNHNLILDELEKSNIAKL